MMKIKKAGRIVFLRGLDVLHFGFDSSESLTNFFVSKRTPKQLELFLAARAGGIGAICDARAIVRITTKDGSDAACQRGILEAAALSMSSAERRRLLVSMGFPYMLEALSHGLRGNTKYRRTKIIKHQGDRVVKHQWYKRGGGKVKAVDALYQIISSNPNAFCLMVAGS